MLPHENKPPGRTRGEFWRIGLFSVSRPARAKTTLTTRQFWRLIIKHFTPEYVQSGIRSNQSVRGARLRHNSNSGNVEAVGHLGP